MEVEVKVKVEKEVEVPLLQRSDLHRHAVRLRILLPVHGVGVDGVRRGRRSGGGKRGRRWRGRKAWSGVVGGEVFQALLGDDEGEGEVGVPV